MTDLQKTLAERGARYGDFTDHARIAQAIQDDMRIGEGWKRLNDVQRQALTVIADKIARILSGDPNYADNWHDIQGYARLVEERLPLMKAEEPAAQMDDDSERMAAIGQNGNDGAYYLAIKPDWSLAPEWAMWIAQDDDGEWWWFSHEPLYGASCWAKTSGNMIFAFKSQLFCDPSEALERRP